jgi:hypothetical protein
MAELPASDLQDMALLQAVRARAGHRRMLHENGVVLLIEGPRPVPPGRDYALLPLRKLQRRAFAVLNRAFLRAKEVETKNSAELFQRSRAISSRYENIIRFE